MDNNLLYIIDDDKIILSYLKRFFVNNGWNTEIFFSAKQMLNALQTKIPALIITDLDMPEMDGIELINRVKAMKVSLDIPILVMTDLHENHIRLRSYKAGALHVVNKPVNPYELEAVVRSFLNQLKQRIPDPRMSKEEVTYKKKSVEKWVNEARNVVLSNLENVDFSLDHLSAELHYSRSAVQKRIKQFTGLSVSKFIRSVRLEKSLELLENGETRIAEAARAVGFKSHSYYSRCFKEYFGIDPIKKRKECSRKGE
jgi:YesN/AraC family two-component response regulator